MASMGAPGRGSGPGKHVAVGSHLTSVRGSVHMPGGGGLDWTIITVHGSSKPRGMTSPSGVPNFHLRLASQLTFGPFILGDVCKN